MQWNFNRLRLTGILFCLLLSAIGISGCSADKTEQEQGKRVFTAPQYEQGSTTGKTLLLWAYSDIERSYMQKAIARYEEATGNIIEIKQFAKEEFMEKTEEAFSGDGEKPDLILSYGGTNIDAFHPDENFYDFSDEIWVDDLTNTSINQTIYNGKVIGLPHWEASVSGTLYNKEIFSKYNIQVPTTQAEFMTACEKLLQNGITPVYMPGGETTMLLYQFPLDTLVQDSSSLDALNHGAKGYADMPQMETVVEWYRTMAQKGYLGSNYSTDNWNGMNEAMKSAKYAMMYCWDTWLYTDFDGDASKFGLMPAFMGVPETGTFEGPNLALLIVNKKSSQLQTAVDFITFMADPYNYNVAFEGIYTAPVFKNQISNISTPQFIESEMLIDKYFLDSTAWLRIKGFSQMDASCILDYMGDTTITAKQCLLEMDRLRNTRIEDTVSKP